MDAASSDGLFYPPAQRGWGALTFGGLVGRIFLNAIVGVIIVSILAFFEEVSPVALALTLPFGIFATGLVIGWLWVKTESIWIVSLAHGALNNWGQYAFKYMQFVRAPDSVVGGAGVLAVLVLGTLLLTLGLPPAGRQRDVA